MFKKLTVFLSSLALFGTLPVTTLAGGGPIYLESQAWIPFNESHAFIIQAHITPDINFDYNCKNIPVTFKFEDPKPGDKIFAEDFDKENSTTTILGYNERVSPNGTHHKDCSAIAKVISGTAETRQIFVEADLPKWGNTVSYMISVPFGTDKDSQAIQNYYEAAPTLPWEEDLPSFEGITEDGTYDGKAPVSFDASNSAKIQELEKKLSNLQQQLDENKKQQNVLQEKLDAIISWIKSIFPWFK